MNKKKNKKKPGKFLDYLDKKNIDNGESEKKTILQIKKRTVCHFQKYVKNFKTYLI